MTFLLKGILFGTALIGSGGIVTGGYIFKDSLKKFLKRSLEEEPEFSSSRAKTRYQPSATIDSWGL